MAGKAIELVDVRTRAAWRSWLAKHHARSSGIWLVFHKRHTGVACVAYEDAVDEALCFGWVDSLIRKLDDTRYARKFTPRRADSKWSAANRARYAALRASGRLAPAGLRRAPTGAGYGPRREWHTLPAYLEAALEAAPAARETFDRLPPSARRNYIGWIDSAKRDDTKQRRLREAIARLTAGEPLGLK
jgi:uncharacterized protein YdeI (YjbR/CyaY-like superfamily)